MGTTKKTLVLIFMFLSLTCLTSAIIITLSSGNKLENSHWTNLSSVLNKVDISWNNININWKLSVNWKICANDLCLWDNPWTQETPWKSCSDLLSKWVNTNWVYYIKPTWYSWSAFQVYCDMKTEWWGWTRYVNIKWNYTLSQAKNCFSKDNWPYLSNQIDCFNPNRYGMNVYELKNKVNWIYFPTKIINTTSSIDTIKWLCTWNEHYMVMYVRDWSTLANDLSNVTHAWLWLSNCKYWRQAWWRSDWSTNKYMNWTNINEIYKQYWPNISNREPNYKSTEIFIR